MTKKPNINQQMAQFFGTPKREEQLEIAKTLSLPVVSIVIQADPRNNLVEVGVVGFPQISYPHLKSILQEAINSVTMREAQLRIEQQKAMEQEIGGDATPPIPEDKEAPE